MRPTYSHTLARAWQIIAALLISTTLSAETLSADSVLFGAYLREDMSVWKEYVEKAQPDLLYEYGYCGYIVDRDKKHALPYVKRLRTHIEAAKNRLPVGHYEMYMSAVYVYELRLKESIHPVKAMNLAKEAVEKAPKDPLVLSYYGTCLFYAPKPFGSKQEALRWFEQAKKNFDSKPSAYRYCWVREANDMYIGQCKEKLNK